MSDLQAKLGLTLLKSLVSLRQEKGEISIEDMGRIFIRMASSYMHDAKAITDASQHLDEVIRATEEAGNAIMDAADAIRQNAAGIGGEKEKKIMDATNRIYESCSFQDSTGQRITRVTKLLSGIVSPEDDGKLLHGPQLPANAATQEEIDRLFAGLGGKK